MPVTTSNGSKEELPAFLSSDKKALFLPSDMPAFQLDFTQYYYPGSVTSAGNLSVKYLILAKFKDLWPTHKVCAINQSRKKQGSLTYVTDRESEVGKIFILSLYSSMDKILISG